MRILIVPRIRKTNGRGSMTIVTLTLMRDIMLEHPDVHFYLAVHEDFTPKVWLKNYEFPDELLHRVTLVPMPEKVIGPTSMEVRKSSLFLASGLRGLIEPTAEYGRWLDAIIVDGFMQAPGVKSIVSGTFSRGVGVDIPMIGWAHWAATERQSYAIYNKYDALHEAHGAVVVDGFVFGSKSQEEDHLAQWRKYLNPAIVRDMQERSVMLNLGVTNFEKTTPDMKVVGRKPVGMWSGYAQEDSKSCVPALINALKLGHLGKVILQLCDDIPPAYLPLFDEWLKVPGVELHGPMPHKEYLKFLNRGDLFVAIVKDQTYGVRYVEMIAAGQLPVLRDDSARRLLWPGYELTASESNVNEQVLTAAKVVMKLPAMRTKVYEVARELHDSKTNNLKFYYFVKEAVLKSQREVDFGDFGLFLKRVMNDVTKISAHDVHSHIERADAGKYSLVKSGMISPRFVRWCMLSLGFKDVGGEVEPYYVR